MQLSWNKKADVQKHLKDMQGGNNVQLTWFDFAGYIIQIFIRKIYLFYLLFSIDINFRRI